MADEISAGPSGAPKSNSQAMEQQVLTELKLREKVNGLLEGTRLSPKYADRLEINTWEMSVEKT